VPTWKELYAVTVLENRPAELQVLIAATERAIFLRLQEMAMAYDVDMTEERLEIDDASSTLRILLGEIMAWQNYEAH
jgi:hypothetical protein